ncbi:hypothetical protein K438DRAFT_554004 [Mycena galopus ATCC 62051]|nr:hypothetical protein K438DRAFT_554004 [Mycena galopus ATCC 62051]
MALPCGRTTPSLSLPHGRFGRFTSSIQPASVGQSILRFHWSVSCAVWRRKVTSHQGLMFKVGIFMGWSDLSIDGTVPWNTLSAIHLGACLWTITYETVYQHQVGQGLVVWSKSESTLL